MASRRRHTGSDMSPARSDGRIRIIPDLTAWTPTMATTFPPGRLTLGREGHALTSSAARRAATPVRLWPPIGRAESRTFDDGPRGQPVEWMSWFAGASAPFWNAEPCPAAVETPRRVDDP